MKNTLDDLNNHLFMAIERLNDESLDAEQLAKEIDRANAISSVAGTIVANAKIQLDAYKIASNAGEFVTCPNTLLEAKK